jgi:hypothetical protein
MNGVSAFIIFHAVYGLVYVPFVLTSPPASQKMNRPITDLRWISSYTEILCRLLTFFSSRTINAAVFSSI